MSWRWAMSTICGAKVPITMIHTWCILENTVLEVLLVQFSLLWCWVLHNMAGQYKREDLIASCE